VVNATGPQPSAQQRSTVVLEHDATSRSLHSRTDSFSVTESSPEGSSSVNEQFLVGNEACRYNGSEWTYQAMSPMEREMSDFLVALPDLNVPIENPQLVGREDVNGVTTEHYSFRLSGLGEQSGAEVRRAEGNYWLAVDGRYLVKYELNVDMGTGPVGDPAAENFQATLTLNLTGINQPLVIGLPAECLAATSGG
jgi:hypothetical protein